METQNKTLNYPYIPLGREIFYADIDNGFMAKAKEVARGSNDQQQPTGAVVVSEGKIIAEASNMNPLSSPFLIRLHKKYCIRHLFHIPSGQKYWLCPGCAGSENHAESRASKQLLKKGVPQSPADLYLWGHWWCCETCWNNMMKIPIRNIYLLTDSEKLFNLKHPDNILGKQFSS
jgi:deoxycytidylate deaminase